LSLQAFTQQLADRGIELWTDGDKLHYRAPKGAITAELRAEISARRQDLLTILASGATHGPATEPMRLSFAQQRLWYVEQYETIGAAYCIVGGARIDGGVDEQRLQAAVGIVIRWHESLRTEFRQVGAEPMQIVHPEVTTPFVFTDLSSEPDPEGAARTLLTTQLIRPFDLSRPPLLRVSLIRQSRERYLLGIAMHHIISDGWSVGTLLRDLSAAYAGESPAQKLPRVSYAELAARQRRELSGSRLAALTKHWRERLAGASELLELPGDRARPSQRDWRGDTVTLRIKAAPLHALARSVRATPFMVALAAFYVLLYRYTGETDLVVGSPVSGRDSPETQGMIGLFVNMLPLRCELSDEPSFQALVDRVRSQFIADMDHSALPFDLVVNAVNPKRDPRWPPVCQVLFAFQNVPPLSLSLRDAELTPINLDTGYARADLSLAVDEHGDDLVLSLEYAADLFDEWRMHALLRHYHGIIGAAASDPSQSIARLSYLDADEIDRQLAMAGTDAPFPSTSTIHSLFASRVAAHPDAVALEPVTGIGPPAAPMTYRELDTASASLARRLRRAGARPNQVLALVADRSIDLIVGMLAILKSGAAYLVLDSELPVARRDLLLADSGAAILVTQQRRAGPLREAIRQIVLRDESSDPPGGPDELSDNRAATPDDLAYVIYTSGSTGRPKGVGITHRNVAALCFGTSRIQNYEGSICLHISSTSFDASIFEIWACLLGGGKLVVAPPGPLGSWDIAEMLRTHSVTNAFFTTGLLNRLIEEVPDALARVDSIWTGGEAASPVHLRAQMARRTGGHVCNAYGPTECTVMASVHRMTSEADVTVPVPIGLPLAHCCIFLLDRHGQPVPLGVPGELHIGGEGVGQGYLNAPELTAKSFIHIRFGSRAPCRVYRTGDKARWRPDGSLEFLGRIDQQIKLRGFRIEPGEIEKHLLELPAIKEAAVVAGNNRSEGKRLIGYLVPANRMDVDILAVRRHLAEVLPRYMVPSAFVLLDRLPLTRSGKIEVSALPPPADGGTPAKSAKPTTPIEICLCAIWAETLNLASVSIDDNFFEIGGDSILSMQIVMRAAAQGLKITLRQILQHQTVAELAQVAVMLAVDYPPAATVTESFPVSLTPIQSWFFELDLAVPKHWNQSILLRLRRAVETTALANALNALLRRHDALRLRFVRAPSGWTATVVPPGPVVPLTMHACNSLPRAGEAFADVCATTQAGLDLGAGPMFRAALFLGDREEPDCLLLVAHHLVVDAVSWRILADDLAALLDGREPPPAPSFANWAERVSVFAQKPSTLAWMDQLPQVPALDPLPRDGTAVEMAESGAVNLQRVLSQEQTRLLLAETNRADRIRPQELLLSVLAGAVASWSGRRRFLVDVEGHGRDILPGVDASRLVGWFTTLTPVLLEVMETDTAGDIIARVKAHTAFVANSGAAFGLLRYLGPAEIRHRLEAQPAAEISFNFLGSIDGALTPSGPFAGAEGNCGPNKAGSNHRPHAIEVVAALEGGRLRVDWHFSPSRHFEPTMTRLAQRFEEVLNEFLIHRRNPGAVVLKPADVPLADLDAPGLERVLSSLGVSSSAVVDLLPLSLQQQGILLGSLAMPGSEIHVEQAVLTLASPFDPTALRAALIDTAERHSVLRTVFVWEALDRPLQAVLRTADLPWRVEVIDREAQPEQHLSDWLVAERRKGICLGEAPLMRIGMADLGNGKWKLALTFHHILLDGWSLPILLSQLLTSYRHRHEGGDAPAAPSPLRQYRDYVLWQASQHIAPAETFWRDALSGLESPTMPGRESPDVASGEGYRDRIATVPPAILAELQVAARRQRLSINALVQGTLALSLAGLAGTRDVIIGTTVSGRPTELDGSAEMVGLFATSLPLRALVPEGGALWPWLRELRDKAEEARRFDYFGTGQIHQWSGLAGAIPLYEVLLVFENYPVGSTESDDGPWAVCEIETHGSRTRYPITLLVMPGEALTIHLIHQQERVPAAAADCLLQALIDSLTHIAMGESEIGSLLARVSPSKPILLPPAPWRRSATCSRPPTTPTEKRVARLWSDLLGVEDISVERNFFEFGGHSLQALEIAARLGKVCGREFPLSLMLSNPTIAGISAAIDQGNLRPLPVVLLGGRAGPEAPLFVLPGASGNIHGYIPLAKRLQDVCPVYGVQYEALRERGGPGASVEELAERAISEMRKLQPNGGLRLVGHSFGGIVALAVAALEEAAGRPPELLTVLDLKPPPGGIEAGLLNDEAGLIAEIATAASKFFERPVLLTLDELRPLDTNQRVLRLQQAFTAAQILPDGVGTTAVEALLDSYRQCIGALRNYVAVPVQVAIHVVEADESPTLAEGLQGWHALTSKGATIHKVSGDHITMIVEPNVAELTDLVRYLYGSCRGQKSDG
jgi:amino acid adenylation domain-containing protein/non-ribosomal peptide synthase protein (TIGR01720 family)